MSIAWMTRVFASPEPTQATERLMLLALADNANDQGVCWPSMNTLRLKCALKTIRGAEKVVARLEKSGFVERELRDGKTTVYHLKSGRLEPDERMEKPVDKSQTPERADGGFSGRLPNARTGVKTGTPEQPDGGPPNAGTGEPSKNHHKEGRQANARARGDVDNLDGSSVREPGELLLAAAASFEDRSGLVEALVAQGVDEPVAAELVARSDPEHVRAMLERGAQEANGPGWYVRALQGKGYRARRVSGTRRRMTHVEALAYLEENDIVITGDNPMDRYLEVERESGTTYFVVKRADHSGATAMASDGEVEA